MELNIIKRIKVVKDLKEALKNVPDDMVLIDPVNISIVKGHLHTYQGQKYYNPHYESGKPNTKCNCCKPKESGIIDVDENVTDFLSVW